MLTNCSFGTKLLQKFIIGLTRSWGSWRAKQQRRGAGESWVHSGAENRELCAHFSPLPTHFSLSLSIDLAKSCCGQVGCIISIYVTGKFLWRVCSHYAKLKKKDKVIPAGAATRYPEKILYDIKPRNYRAASTNANWWSWTGRKIASCRNYNLQLTAAGRKS